MMATVTATKRKRPGRENANRGAYDSRINGVDVDFGTYHHSTSQESNEIRQRAERSFSRLLRSFLSFGRRSPNSGRRMRARLSDVRGRQVFSESADYGH